jgi:hypothetical protein
MEGSQQLSEFVQRLSSDDALKRKVFFAEAAAASQLETIVQAAKELGYDISGSLGRPAADLIPTDAEFDSSCGPIDATCCYLVTSVWPIAEPE